MCNNNVLTQLDTEVHFKLKRSIFYIYTESQCQFVNVKRKID